MAKKSTKKEKPAKKPKEKPAPKHHQTTDEWIRGGGKGGGYHGWRLKGGKRKKPPAWKG